jgi:hypothetical protein
MAFRLIGSVEDSMRSRPSGLLLLFLVSCSEATPASLVPQDMNPNRDAGGTVQVPDLAMITPDTSLSSPDTALVVDAALPPKPDSALPDTEIVKMDTAVFSPDLGTPIGNPSPSSWLFVVGRPTELLPGESALIDHAEKQKTPFAALESRTFPASDSPTGGVNFIWGRKGVIIAGSGSSTALDAAKAFMTIPMPMVVFYDRIYNFNAQTAWMTPKASATGKKVTGEVESTEVTIVATDPAMTGGLTGTVTVASSTMRMAWGTPQSTAAIVVATLPEMPTAAAVFAYPKGAIMEDGKPAPAARVGFFFSGDDGGELNDNGYKLLDAMLEWAVSH